MFKNNPMSIFFWQTLRTVALVQQSKDWVLPGQYGISQQKSRLMPPYSYEIYLGIGFVKDSFKDRKIKGKKNCFTHSTHLSGPLTFNVCYSFFRFPEVISIAIGYKNWSFLFQEIKAHSNFLQWNLEMVHFNLYIVKNYIIW